MAKKEKNPKFEIIINGKVIKAVTGFDRIDNEEAKFDEKCRKQNFEEIQSSSSGYRGYNLYFNEDSLETRVFAWREITPFVDKKGNVIYSGDYLTDGYGNVYALSQYPTFTDEEMPYYIRGERGDKIDITADEIKKGYTVKRYIFPTIPSFNKAKS